jgi:hypothetical protein
VDFKEDLANHLSTITMFAMLDLEISNEERMFEVASRNQSRYTIHGKLEYLTLPLN